MVVKKKYPHCKGKESTLNHVSSINLSIVRAVEAVKNDRRIMELKALRDTGMACQSELDRQLSIRDTRATKDTEIWSGGECPDCNARAKFVTKDGIMTKEYYLCPDCDKRLSENEVVWGEDLHKEK